ncbi:uncharacterized protein BP5553_02755 [Venustampulla echinocandica]|uniref:HOOK N-terminal domain-containing protein n=1 Tax=Venustampulla echinocandica TaxID=2656787 RepID=A0A370TSA9_9HELO|nr:uncharacterized protein BP5553_02755 [Venustampulla echinocandica]RDL38415.1 hypothetical protein BP5553_02755 [Venustampulla echinocandica]
MPYSRIEQAALLKWVNTFPLDYEVESLANLTDGFVPSKMLEDIDPKYAVRDLEINSTASRWLGKKKNLEAVSKSLFRYIRKHCDDLDPIALESDIDFNAMAEHDDVEQMAKLLTVLLLAAVRGSNNEKYVTKITNDLDPDTQSQVANIIQSVTEGNTRSPADNNAGPDQAVAKDPELALEAEHATLLAEHEGLKKKHADFITRFERLQQSHDELLEHSNEVDRQLDDLQNSQSGDQTEYIQSLKGQLLEANELIANQEQQAETDRVTKERQERELQSLRPSAERLINLEDHLKELKAENVTLSRKANTLDHFQKKLEAQSGVEKDNTDLRRRIDVLEENQKTFDKVHEENSKMQMTLAEYQQRFHSYELNVVERAGQTKILEEHLRQRDAQIQNLLASKAHDERFIEDLQESLKTGGVGPLSPPSPTATATTLHLSLGDELDQTDDVNYPLQLSRLKAEIQLLKSNSAGTTNVNLRIDLEESDRVRKRLELNLRDLQEKHAIGQHQLGAMISKIDSEKLVPLVDELMKTGPFQIFMPEFYRDEAVAATRRLYMEAVQELLLIKTKLAETEAELSSRERDLLAAKADLSAIDQGEIDGLEELKTANELITSSLQNDLLLCQSKMRNLSTDFEQQKSHLLDALLAKDRLTQEIVKLQEGTSTSRGADKTQPDEATNAALQKSKEQIEKQEAAIQDLQRKLKTAEESSPDAQKAANEATIKNLTRENALIASAWYDITGRLQSNHVVLQRRQDAPKSWLNKQRQMVNAIPRR